jgi:hypothetical protein
MQTMVEKGTLVADIVKTREPLVKKIEEQRINLLKLGQILRALADLRTQVTQSSDIHLAEQIKGVDLTRLQSGIQTELETLSHLQSRFMRKTLNVGVIGRARQGKSRLLQSLSGLDEQEIPTGDLGACTGVRSTIMHNAEESYGQVYYYTEREFLDDVLGLYYEELQLGPVPDDINQFAMRPLSLLPDRLKGYKTDEAKYDRLKKYREHIVAYRSLINHPTERVGLENVREYVAQLTVDGKDLYKHYAVKEVRIFCSFPHANDVEQVAFIDMPGMGDTGMGDEERLIKALGEDLDIALVVRRPVAGGDLPQADTDVAFYDTAQKPLKDLLPFHQWAFLILNRTEDPVTGDNLKNCEFLQAFMNASYANKAFADSLIVDCSKPEEVNTYILEPVLKYLLQNIQQLDEQYVRACENGLERLHKHTIDELAKALAAFGKADVDKDDHGLFQMRFADTWEKLMSGLVALLKTLEQKSNTPDADFSKYFEGRIEACKNNPGIPSTERIRKRHGEKNSYEIVYYEALDEMRVHLTYNFINLDNALENSMKSVKKDVAKIFLEQGHLAALLGMNEDEFFQWMVEQVDCARLKHVFRVFDEYKLSYRGFFQQRIRKHLYHLKPDFTSIKLALQPGMNDEAKEKAVVDALRQAYSLSVESLRKELFTYIAEPNQAAFAIVEEFVDQAMRAHGAIEEWNNFYYPIRVQVWESDFKRLVEWKRWRKDWADLVSTAQEANALILLK